MDRSSPEIKLMSSGGLLSRSTPIFLEADQIVHGLGAPKRIIKLSDVSVIRLDTTRRKRFCLVLDEIGGKKTVITEGVNNTDPNSFSAFVCALLTRMPQLNQFVTYEIGPSIKIWIAAWIGLFVSIAITIGVLWAALIEQRLPTAILPFAIAPVIMVFVAPILMAGRCQKVGLHMFLTALAERQMI